MTFTDAIRAGAHLEFDTRWLRNDGINWVVYEEYEQKDSCRVAILYSGKDAKHAADVLMRGKEAA